MCVLSFEFIPKKVTQVASADGRRQRTGPNLTCSIHLRNRVF